MIRINLLGRPRPRVKRRVAVTGTLQLALFVIPLLLAFVLLGVHYKFIQDDIASLQEQINQKQAEKKEMAQLEAEIADFEAKQSMLEGRIKVIEDLKRSQAGPMQMLQAVGRTVSLTETLWLTSMKDTGANKVEFKGVAGSLNAVADFITNLNSSGYFDEVEMKETAQQTGSKESTGTNFDFTVTAKFSLPAPPEGEAGAEGEAAPAASGQQ